MITEKNFGAALKVMGFNENGGVYEKIFADNVTMSADLKNKKLSYPAQVINRDSNTSFNKSLRESLVVFECVNRLLDKGYKPEDIWLEKPYKLGHTQKSGRADICVSHEGKTLLIIECKTAGAEYENALKLLKTDGGQLFSYWQQDRSCQWIELYASDFDKDKLKFSAASVSCDKEIYKDANTVEDLFKIWNEKFQKQPSDDVIFHDETIAYRIGIKPLRKKYLKDFDDNGVVNNFEEALRHNNVSDKENAFNRLVALFVCKIYDELKKDDNQEVDFQYKFGRDNYEVFQDRLQYLYQKGMDEFMREPITYVPLSAIDDLFKQNQENRAVLKNIIKEKFRQQKFFTNNDFAFMDVHNKKLFEKNAEILIEVVNIFKDYRIIGAKNLQTLGDLFEQLLDKGFKQNEGQFFTPLPITRFIWDSLPLEQIISIDNKITLPKIIDYACGAGHFLTQGFEAINDFFKRQNISPPTYWEDEKLFGVEKDYRLARVSKISLFMHGAEKGKIKFGDGLEDYPDAGFTSGTFDILVSNPPYSIKDFKQYLTLENHFDTLEKISIHGSEIETLFVERIAQLLKPGGIAAVILPSSILNKDGKSFVSAREKILQYFYVKAVAEFGSKTFGATGTKTNILFLQKISDPPERFRLFEDTVNGIFANDFNGHWDNEKVFGAWLDKIHVDAATYKKFILREVDYTFWQNHSYFGEYFSDFKETPPKTFSDADKIAWLNNKFYESAHAVEKEKIWYFAQTYTQTTLIISAPDGNAAQEKFLGYTWSKRKTAEGIKISNEGGLLYNPKNRRADEKLAAAVRRTFYGEKVSIPAAQKYFYYLNLADMIDFSGAKFTKTVKLVKKSSNEVFYSGKYPLVKLGSIGKVSMCKRIMKYETEPSGDIPFYKIGTFGKTADAYITKEKFDDYSQNYPYPKKGDILISAAGTIGKTLIFDGKPAYFQDSNIVWLENDESVVINSFLNIFYQTNPFQITDGPIIKRLYNAGIENTKIPVPPIDEQQKIVEEFRAVDDEISAQEKFIAACDDDVKSKFEEIFGGVNEKISIGECCEIEKGGNLTREQAVAGDVPVVAGGILPSCYHNVANRPANIITISASGNAGYVNFWRVPIFATDCNTLKSKSNFSIEFIYYALKMIQDDIYKLRRGMAQQHVYANDIAKLQIPIPPKELQEKFALYVTELEDKKLAAQKRIDELKLLRESLVEKYFR